MSTGKNRITKDGPYFLHLAFEFMSRTRYMQEIPAAFDRLESIEADCWQRIQGGLRSYRDDYRQAFIANLGDGFPNVRTITLRHVWVPERRLAFHVDERKQLVKEFRQDPRVTWLFYSRDQRIQIRLSGLMHFETETALANDSWAATNTGSRKSYMAPLAPGNIAESFTSGWPAGLEDRKPELVESEVGRANFAVAVTNVHAMDWVWLHYQGQRRAHFTYADDGSYQATFLTP